jgi:uncharacterized protein
MFMPKRENMIIETIFSTINEQGKPNFAPMGLLCSEDTIKLRIFRDTQTFRNIVAIRHGVANLTDDVLAFVRSGIFNETLPFFPAKVVPGVVFDKTCSWWELSVEPATITSDPAEIECRILHKETRKEFTGYCRAGGAVIEAAILATRLDFKNHDMILQKMIEYAEIVGKTGGYSEKKAFEMVREFIEQRTRQ